MMSTKVFADINKMSPIEGMTGDPQEESEMESQRHSRQGWFQKLFKFRRQTSAPASTSNSKN